MSIFKYFNFFNTDKQKKYKRLVKHVNSLAKSYQEKTDIQLKEETQNLKNLFQLHGFSKDLICRALANAKEGATRSLKLTPFDVQLIGALALHDGNVAEMKTGEGKTLVAAIAAYLNSLSGEQVHVVTVNSYLARRDSDTMGRFLDKLGVTTGCVVDDMDLAFKQKQYECEVVYITNHEVGFDYLRDNMVLRIEERTITKRGMNFAIIDEADSILIDESRTPLIISGPSVQNKEIYGFIDKIVKKLYKNDYDVDEKYKNAQLTEVGIIKVENILKASKIIPQTGTLHEAKNISIIHNILQSIKANYIFKKNVDYIVKNGKVIIIDEFTGRKMEDRRYSEGLHQAIEAKEGVPIQAENQTIATITYQNLFRMYRKLSGMTGTAMTEAAELRSIYNLDVVQIETNKPVVRKDHNDEIYATKAVKYKHIVELVKQVNAKKQPVLIGTTDINTSEELSDYLTRERLDHNVLNAKYHEKEALIISEAGRAGRITIATNMAGRGTDIKLGGDLDYKLTQLPSDATFEDIEILKREHQNEKEQVLKAGGLFVIGSERHESRRIDDQLKGRSGRQGDPGESRFFLSLEDSLLRLFGGERIEKLLKMFGFKEDEKLDHSMLNKIIKKSQKRIENIHYEMRKNVLQYDNIVSEQREQIYKYRNDFLQSKDIVDEFKELVLNFNQETHYSLIEKESGEASQDSVLNFFSVLYNVNIQYPHEESILHVIDQIATEIIEGKVNEFQENDDDFSNALRYILLSSIDSAWQEHLYQITHLKESIGYRSYAQKNPIYEYKIETFKLFEETIHRFIQTAIFNVARVQCAKVSE